jgi:hypothetical protein
MNGSVKSQRSKNFLMKEVKEKAARECSEEVNYLIESLDGLY